MNDIKFSIITVCKNEEKYIEKTIQSVLNQTYKNFELIVVDGHSTDNTLNILKKYKSQIKLIFDDGKGVYSAMNLGIKQAVGDFICFVNGNDFFYDDNVLVVINKEINLHKDAEFVLGDAQVLYEDFKTRNICYKDFKNVETFLKGHFLNHQSIFYKKSLFDRYGLYSTKYKLISDNEFNIKCLFKKNCKYLYVNNFVSKRTWGGLTSLYLDLLRKEEQEVLCKSFPFLKLFYKIILLIKYFYPNIYLFLFETINKNYFLNFSK